MGKQPIKTFDFLAGETIPVNKPYRWTSFDVVNKVRYEVKNHLRIPKMKIGHAGTLDPLATGLLILCTGKHTKQIESMQDLDKGIQWDNPAWSYNTIF
jgi:tRNA pseudouridine55 synthase